MMFSSYIIIYYVLDCIFNRDDLYLSSRYTTYEYDDDSAPHSSRDYYESSDYPGKLFIYLIILKIKSILHLIINCLLYYFNNKKCLELDCVFT